VENRVPLGTKEINLRALETGISISVQIRLQYG
jgi:hypothetical protein